VSRRHLLRGAAAAACAALAACHTGVGGHLSERDQDAIRRTTGEAVRLALAPDADAYVKSYYAPEAMMLVPNEPILAGREAIRGFVSGFLPMVSYEASIEAIEGRNDLAYVQGRYAMTWTPAGREAVSDRGKYLEIWKKVGGRWQVVLDTFNSDLPAPGLLVTTSPRAGDAPPELRRLSFLLGAWTYAGQTEKTALGPAGRSEGRLDCHWFAGGRQMLCRSGGSGPSGPVHALEIYGWDGEARSYTYYGVDSTGAAAGARGSRADRTWTFALDLKADGKPARMRATTVEESATAFEWTNDLSIAGGAWTTVSSGRAEKVR
jgi:ketosteroid isomerase-like protein